jgi:hypothetical protein
MKERVLGDPIMTIRKELSLAVSLIEENDPGFESLPLGLDSGITLSSIFVSGVFSKVALMALQTEYKSTVPAEFSIYSFQAARDQSAAKVFFPKTGFKTCNEAILATKNASGPLSEAHHAHAAKAAAGVSVIMPPRPRVELP